MWGEAEDMRKHFGVRDVFLTLWRWFHGCIHIKEVAKLYTFFFQDHGGCNVGLFIYSFGYIGS